MKRPALSRKSFAVIRSVITKKRPASSRKTATKSHLLRQEAAWAKIVEFQEAHGGRPPRRSHEWYGNQNENKLAQQLKKLLASGRRSQKIDRLVAEHKGLSAQYDEHTAKLAKHKETEEDVVLPGEQGVTPLSKRKRERSMSCESRQSRTHPSETPRNCIRIKLRQKKDDE